MIGWWDEMRLVDHIFEPLWKKPPLQPPEGRQSRPNCFERRLEIIPPPRAAWRSSVEAKLLRKTRKPLATRRGGIQERTVIKEDQKALRVVERNVFSFFINIFRNFSDFLNFRKFSKLFINIDCTRIFHYLLFFFLFF